MLGIIPFLCDKCGKSFVIKSITIKQVCWDNQFDVNVSDTNSKISKTNSKSPKIIAKQMPKYQTATSICKILQNVHMAVLLKHWRIHTWEKPFSCDDCKSALHIK